MKKFLTICMIVLTAGIANAKDQPEYFTTYHPNGSIKTLYTNEGNVLRVDMYHPNGKLAQIGYLKDGQRHGVWVTWDEQGNKMARAEFRNDKKVGTWSVWHENGNLQYRITYRKDHRVAVTEFDEIGNTVAVR